MKFGIAYPNLLDGDEIRQFAVRTEELGFESIWAGDHVVFPAGPVSGYPYTESGSFQRTSDYDACVRMIEHLAERVMVKFDA